MTSTLKEKTVPSSRPDRKQRLDWTKIGKQYALVAALIVVFVFFSTYGPTSDAFPSHANIVTVLGNQTVALIIGLAAVVPLLANVLDLSIASSAGLASVVTAGAITNEQAPLAVAIVLGVMSGAAVGAVNGWLITRFRFDPIIETLAMGMLLTGLCTWYTSGTPISIVGSPDLTNFGSLNWLGVPRLMIVLVPLVLVAWYVTEHTPFGRRLAAIGSNRNAASLVGIRVERTVAASLLASGTLAGIAGVLLTARAGSADTQTGPSYLFPALAAVFLGMTAIKLGFPNVFGTVLGTFFVAFTVSGLNIAGTSLWAPNVFNGLSLLVALWVMSSTNLVRRGKKKVPA